MGRGGSVVLIVFAMCAALSCLAARQRAWRGSPKMARMRSVCSVRALAGDGGAHLLERPLAADKSAAHHRQRTCPGGAAYMSTHGRGSPARGGAQRKALDSFAANR